MNCNPLMNRNLIRNRNRMFVVLNILFVLLLTSLTMNSAQAQGGYTLDFDGTGEYVETAYDADLNPTNFTLEAWVKVEGGAGIYRSVMTSRQINNTGGYMIYVGDDNQWQFWTGNNTNSGWNTQNSGIAASSEWTHLACSYDGTNKNIYINGVLAISSVESYAPNTTRPLRIGAGTTETTPNYYFPGKIDEVRVWSDVRTQAEIQANMHKELVGNEANLEAYYQMSNGSGTSLTDNSTNSNTGTLTNSPTWKTSGALAGSGTALNFDGSDDEVHSTITMTSTDTFTLETWINFESLTSKQSLLDFQQSVSGAQLTVSKENTTNLLTIFIDDGTSTTTLYSSVAIAANQWYHLAIVYAEKQVLLYVNGAQTMNGSTVLSYRTTASNDFYIGASDGSSHSDAIIDEVRVWDDIRSQSEILSGMFRTLEGDETNLVAYYRFDQQPAVGNTTLYDYSVNGLDGTLSNMDATTDWVSSAPFNTWIGSESSDWSNGDNWSSGSVPSTEDVGVYGWPGSNSPASGNISGRNVYIDTDASVSHSGNLIISNNFFNAGTFSTSGSLTFSGSSMQFIAGSGASTVGTLTVNNATGVLMDNDLTTTTDLTLTSGALTIGANTLTINGAISQTSGSMTGGSTSSIIIGGSGASASLPSVDLNTLTLNRANGITIGGTVTVAGSLTLTSGVIDLNSRSLQLGNSATISGTPGTSNHIDATSGSFQKGYGSTGSFTFPVGDGTNYSPITLNFTAATFATGLASVNLTDAKHSNNSSTTDYITRYWTVSSSGITDFSCDVTATYIVGDVVGTEGNLYSGKYSGGDWTLLNQANAGTHAISGTVTGFSDFTAGETSAFPVEWLSFEAKVEGDIVRLDWATASELNSDYFAIERSGDQRMWSPLEQVGAAGNSTGIQHYRYDDTQPLNGKAYYRLRQVDLDGAVDFSAVVEITLIGSEILAVYPNPVQEVLKIEVADNQKMHAMMIDMQGRVVVETVLITGTNSLLVSHLPAGIYTLRLSDQQGWVQEKQIVKE